MDQVIGVFFVLLLFANIKSKIQINKQNIISLTMNGNKIYTSIDMENNKSF